MINKIILNLMFLTLFIACSSSGNDQNIQDDILMELMTILYFQRHLLMDWNLNSVKNTMLVNCRMHLKLIMVFSEKRI